MTTLQQELETIDTTYQRQPPHTLRSLRHHLKRLIERYGEHQTGPFILRSAPPTLFTTLCRHSTAASCILDALRDNLSLNATRSAPAPYLVAPFACAAERATDLDQVLSHDLGSEDLENDV